MLSLITRTNLYQRIFLDAFRNVVYTLINLTNTFSVRFRPVLFVKLNLDDNKCKTRYVQLKIHLHHLFTIYNDFIWLNKYIQPFITDGI